MQIGGRKLFGDEAALIRLVVSVRITGGYLGPKEFSLTHLHIIAIPGVTTLTCATIVQRVVLTIVA